MEKTLPSEGNRFPSVPGAAADPDLSTGPNPLERLASFRFTYVAICAFIALYLFSVRALERSLDSYFQAEISAAANRVDPRQGSVAAQVRRNVDAVLGGSRWIRPGGVRVTALVLGADGVTLLYTESQPEREPPPGVDESQLLPPLVNVVAAVPHNALASNGILIGYAALLLTTLFVYTRTLTQREAQRLAAARSARDESARRAGEIEAELLGIRERLARVTPVAEAHADEIRALQSERAALTAKLEEVASREAALHAEADHDEGLEAERQTLEELLDEALGDLDSKEQEIQTLQSQIRKQGSRGARESSRPSDLLGRRLRTLYKTLEIDDRAVQDLIALRDDAMQLKAEEQIKRLADDSDHTAVRRKIGGLPAHLSIFELSFGGKGRIYYTKGRSRRHRVLLVGAKNTQKPDLEYLSRLPKE